ncbi:hypothetical protein BH24ACT5_BH24ACT5_30660 [soil metagenome]
MVETRAGARGARRETSPSARAAASGPDTMPGMYEFDSVSVSSFEASTLTPKLTERSTEGWEIVSILTAGSDVVAFLRRSTAPADTSTSESDAATTRSSSDQTTPESTAPSTESSPSGSGTTGDQPSPAESSTSAGWGTGTATSQDNTSSAGSWGSGQAAAASQWGGSSQAAVPQASSAGAPAGWYADPAGRYELRYWDGGAWTEHVSRAGQQYTDPPVA